MMAAAEFPMSVDAQPTPPQASIAQPLTTQSTFDESEDDLEWEYEYSTTETEAR
jgi:hypothetical protein